MSDPVQINEAFFLQLYHHPALVALCDAGANRIAARARTIARKDSGDYAGSIHVEHGSRGGRHVSLVVADDWKSLLRESTDGTLLRATIQVASGG